MLYVDTANRKGVVNSHLAIWCRMTAGDLNELHYWARRLGVSIRNFCPAQPEPYTVDGIGLEIREPCYLVTAGHAERAVTLLGAKRKILENPVASEPITPL